MKRFLGIYIAILVVDLLMLGNVFAAAIDITANWTVVTGDPIITNGAKFIGEFTLTVPDTLNVFSLDSTVVDQGTTTFSGSSFVSGTIDKLHLINANGGSGKTLTLNGNGKTATTLNFGDDGTVSLSPGIVLTATTTTTTDNTGTLTLSMGVGTINGNVGATGKALKFLTVDNTGTLAMNGNVVATTINLAGVSTITLQTGKNITAAVTGTGTLSFAAGASDNIITGQVGTSSVTLAAITTATTGTTTFANDVYATTVTLSGAGKAQFNGAVTATNLNLGSTGTVTLNVASAITTTTLGAAGTLGLENTLTGNVNNGGFLLTANNSGSGAINGIISGNGGLIKTGAGTLALNGANTYTGATTISAGKLSAASLNSVSGGSVSSSLGAPTTVNNGTIALGNLATIGTLIYTGTGETTDRVISLVGTTGGGALDQTGTGLLKFTSDVTAPGTTAVDNRKTLTLQGSTTGTGEISGKIVDSTLGAAGQLATSVTKTGTSTWTLSGANTYTGNTTINQGTLSGTTNAAAFGTSTIIIGNSAGANNATLSSGFAGTFANVISVASGNTGTATITSTAAGIFSGEVTLNSHDLTLTTSTAPLTLSGGVTSTGTGGNLILNATAGNAITLSTTAINNILSITNSGVGTATNVISANIGANVTGITQNAANSALTLSGENIFTGLGGSGVTLTQGTLNINNAKALGATACTFIITSGTIDNTSAGDITLTNNNSQAWNNGFTYAGSLHSLNLSTGAVTLNATPTVTVSGNTLTIGGIISGEFGLTKAGVGTLILSGANTYTGTTTINAGTLELTNGAAIANTGAVSLANVAGAILKFNASETIGSLSGGGTTGGNVDLGAYTLTVGDANNTVYSGIISNSSGGSLTKVGEGTLTFSGAHHTYTGVTTINTGTLALTGATTIGGDIAHTATSTLDLGANTLTLDGTGSYTQADTPTLKTTIQDATTAGNINASGATTGKMTTLAGSTLSVTVPTGTRIAVGTKWTILDGKTGSGGSIALPAVTSSNPRVSFSLATADTGADLVLEVLTWGTAYSNTATNTNSQAAGAALDTITNPTGDMATVLNTLDTLSDAQISAALDTMSPQINSGILDNSSAALNNFVGASLNRAQSVLTLAAAENSADSGISSGDENKFKSIWAKGYGSYLDQGTRSGIQGYDAWNAGTAIGVDRLFGDVLTIGISGGYAFGKVNSAANNAKTDITSGQGTVYAGYQDANIPFFIDAAGSFAWNWYQGQRNVRVGLIDRTANADYHGQQYGLYLGGGYKFKLGNNLELTPLASIQWNRLSLAGYTETNADSMNLSVNRQSYDILQSGLGASIAVPLKYQWGNFTPELHAKWLYDFIADAMAMTSTFTGGGGSFISNGAKPAKSGISLGGKLSFDLKNDVSIVAECETQMRSEFFGVYGSVALRYKF